MLLKQKERTNTMKRRKATISKLAAVMLSMALAVFAMPTATMTVHAGHNDDINDGLAHPSEEAGYQSGGESFVDDSSSDSGSSSSSDSGYSDSSYSDSSSGSGSYDSGSSGSGSYDSGSSNADSGSSQASAPVVSVSRGNTVTVPGYETWRQINKLAEGKSSVYHCGIEQYTLQLTDADGNAVACKSVSMMQSTDGKWYLNVATADGVDTIGYVISTYKGSATYLPKLGISGVMLNGVVAVEALTA